MDRVACVDVFVAWCLFLGGCVVGELDGVLELWCNMHVMWENESMVRAIIRLLLQESKLDGVVGLSGEGRFSSLGANQR